MHHQSSEGKHAILGFPAGYTTTHPVCTDNDARYHGDTRSRRRVHQSRDPRRRHGVSLRRARLSLTCHPVHRSAPETRRRTPNAGLRRFHAWCCHATPRTAGEQGVWTPSISGSSVAATALIWPTSQRGKGANWPCLPNVCAFPRAPHQEACQRPAKEGGAAAVRPNCQTPSAISPPARMRPRRRGIPVRDDAMMLYQDVCGLRRQTGNDIREKMQWSKKCPEPR
jgi:hypothetical protein